MVIMFNIFSFFNDIRWSCKSHDKKWPGNLHLYNKYGNLETDEGETDTD